MLYFLAAIFYIGTALCVVLGLVHFGSGDAAAGIFDIAGVISTLFFGSMCAAAQRALDLLSAIAHPNEQPPRLETESEREERMARVARWQD